MSKDTTKTLEIKAKSDFFSIPQEKISQIYDLPIVDVCESLGINLQKDGAGHKALCPFHNEKTPSFKINPKLNIAKCFGCGEGGGPINLTMKKQGIGFVEAVKFLANKFNINIPARELTDEDRQQLLKIEALRVVNEKAHHYFTSNLSGGPLQYCLNRWPQDSISTFALGYAPDKWEGLVSFFKLKGISLELAEEAGLIQSKNGNYFDVFRNRITFPLFNKYGNIVGFTARSFGEENPKYKNSSESPIFKKSNLLFGLDLGRRLIKELGLVFICEGNADAIRLHSLGIHNSVATMTTHASDYQFKELRAICKAITLIPDTDEAGKKAAIKNGINALELGFFVSIMILPDKDENGNPQKNDADSFFSDRQQFDDYSKSHTYDFIEWFYTKHLQKGDGNQQIAIIEKIVAMLATDAGQSKLDYYLTNLAKIVPNKRDWSRKVDELFAENEKKELENDKEIDYSLLQKYGFYEKKNSLYFQTKSGTTRGANFTLKPISHVVSNINSKRLYLMANQFGYEQIIELTQEDLVSLSKFRKAVESRGNYIWEAGEAELIKYKRYLYEKTDTCYEITQLGWQPKDGFYAFGNGIFNEIFKETDEYGIVTHNGKNFLLPAFSKAHEGEPECYQFEKSFIYRPEGTVSLYDYTSLFIKVYGNNGIVGLIFLLSSLFRDIIVRTTHNYPLLNLFGPKGAGKTEMGRSLMSFFVTRNVPPNLNNSTVPAINDAISQSCNALAHLDEYKNDLDIIKIELLKGIFDLTGRTRMNMDRDKKRETTSVDCGVMVSGQEMPTADIALFSRLIFLAFHKTTYSQEEKSHFEKLKKYDEVGLSHLTIEILAKREIMLDKWLENYNQTSLIFQDKLKGTPIEDRIFRSWLILASTFKTLENQFNLPFNYAEVEKICLDGIKEQNEKTSSSNEVSNFWNTIDVVVANGLMRWNIDFVVRKTTKLKTDAINPEWAEGKMVLYINHTLALDFYAKHCKSKVLPRETMIYYLRNSKLYLGEKKAHKFYKWNHDVKGFALNPEGKRLPKVTNVMCFEYDLLNLNLHEANPFIYDDLELLEKHEIIEKTENINNEEPVLVGENDDELPF